MSCKARKDGTEPSGCSHAHVQGGVRVGAPLFLLLPRVHISASLKLDRYHTHREKVDTYPTEDFLERSTAASRLRAAGPGWGKYLTPGSSIDLKVSHHELFFWSTSIHFVHACFCSLI